MGAVVDAATLTADDEKARADGSAGVRDKQVVSVCCPGVDASGSIVPEELAVGDDRFTHERHDDR